MTDTTIPEIVLPQSIPTIGTMNKSACDRKELMTKDILYCSGVQNGCTPMAKRIPIMETGMVDPSIPRRTEGNCGNPESMTELVEDPYDVPCSHNASSTC